MTAIKLNLSCWLLCRLLQILFLLFQTHKHLKGSSEERIEESCSCLNEPQLGECKATGNKRFRDTCRPILDLWGAAQERKVVRKVDESRMNSTKTEIVFYSVSRSVPKKLSLHHLACKALPSDVTQPVSTVRLLGVRTTSDCLGSRSAGPEALSGRRCCCGTCEEDVMPATWGPHHSLRRPRGSSPLSAASDARQCPHRPVS